MFNLSHMYIVAAFSIKANEVGLPTSTPTVVAALSNVVTLLIGLVGLLSVLFIVVGGIKIVTSNGDPARYKSGRDTIMYSVIGIILSIAAYAIVTFVAANVK